MSSPPSIHDPAPKSRGTVTVLHFASGQSGAPIPLRVHFTLLLALPYFALVFSRQLGMSGSTATFFVASLLSLLLSVSLFLSVAIHELCHTLVGARLGGRVRAITLMFLGGVSEMSEPPRTMGGEVLMALAGPLASLALAAAGYWLSVVLRGLPQIVVQLFAQMNLAIGLFNLLPAFPLDGGRVLRGLLAYPLGAGRATVVAAWVGRLLAILLGAFGIFSANPLLAMIALFVYAGASAEGKSGLAEARLRNLPVSRLMSPGLTAIPADLPLDDAAVRLSATLRAVLLVEREGRIVGRLRADRLQAVPYAYRPTITVAAIMEEPPTPVTPDDTVSAAVRRMREESVDELPVVAAGHVTGVLRMSEVDRFLAEEPATRG